MSASHSLRVFSSGLALTAVVGCSGYHASTVAERISRSPSGRVWVTGSDGFAAVLDERGYRRVDYPRDPGLQSWAYESFSVPTARVVAVDGGDVLWTRPGEAFMQEGNAWRRLPIHLPKSDLDDTQIDSVLTAPDGRLLVYLHSRTLVWGTLADLERGRAVTELLPSYFTWLGFRDGSLWAGGYDVNTPAVAQRTSAGQWHFIPVDDIGQVLGIFNRPHAPAAALGMNGILELSDSTPRRFVDAKTLFASLRAPRANVAVVATDGPAAVSVPHETAVPGPSPPQSVSPEAVASSTAVVASDRPGPPEPTSSAWHAFKLFDLDGGAEAVAVGTEQWGVQIVDADSSTWLPCLDATSFIGVVRTANGFLAADSDGALYDLTIDGCKLRQKGFDLGASTRP